jgi:hypothetical protein
VEKRTLTRLRLIETNQFILGLALNAKAAQLELATALWRRHRDVFAAQCDFSYKQLNALFLFARQPWPSRVRRPS